MFDGGSMEGRPASLGEAFVDATAFAASFGLSGRASTDSATSIRQGGAVTVSRASADASAFAAGPAELASAAAFATAEVSHANAAWAVVSEQTVTHASYGDVSYAVAEASVTALGVSAAVGGLGSPFAGWIA